MLSPSIPTVLRNYNGSIREPSQNDVLCGKDTTLARHPGNQKFRALIQENLPGYLKARSKQEKMQITKRIVSLLSKSSRFLKLKNGSSGEWIEIDGQCARDKVSHALRFAARQQEKATTKAVSDDSASSCSEEEEETVPPPPMPARQVLDERNTTNVEKLFAAFDQPLTEPCDAPVRRDSAHLLLSFLSTVDFEDEETAQEEALGASFSFDLGLDVSAAAALDDAITQWAACW